MTFEEFLMKIVMEAFPQYTDDDYSDLYDSWLAEQSVDEIIRLANLFGEQKSIEGKKKVSF